MCAPVLPLIATGIGAIGSGFNLAASISQAHAQAAAAEASAAAERNAAQIDQANTRQQALNQYRQMAAASSRMQMIAAANGDAIDFGTAANAANDAQVLGQEAIARTYAQGNQTMLGHDIAIANDMGQANAANNRATSGILGGLFSAANGSFGSALGNSNQYSGFKAGMGL